MVRPRFPFAVALLLVLTVSGSVSAQQFSGTKVVETGVNYPGVGTFNSFSFSPPPGPVPARPSLSGTNVTFGGTLSTGAPAFSLSSGGTVSPIVVAGVTPVPSGSGNFTAFSLFPVGLSGGVYAFTGNGAPPNPGNLGVFSNATGSLAAAANLTTPYPGGGSFANFSPPAVSGSTVVFSATNVPAPFGPGNPPIGVFTSTSGTIFPVATPSTTMPSGGTFAAFDNPTLGIYLPSISGANIVFGGRNAANSTFGLYFTNGFGITAIATNGTAIPGGSGNFTSFGLVPAISGSNVAFFGQGAGQQGIYHWSGGAAVLVGNRGTTVPGTGVAFSSFTPTDVAISGNRVAFRGTGPGLAGIYTDPTGILTKVIATGDTLDGKTVDEVNIGQFAFDGSTIAVLVSFTNGSDGVYTFTPVPEPMGFLALGAASLLVTRIRKRH